MHTHTYTHTHTHTHTSMHTGMHIHTHTKTHAHTHTLVSHTHTHTCARAHTYTHSFKFNKHIQFFNTVSNNESENELKLKYLWGRQGTIQAQTVKHTSVQTVFILTSANITTTFI